MTVRVWAVAVVALACGGSAFGCHHRASSGSELSQTLADSTPPASEDSLTGIVSVTGTSFEQRIVLRRGDATATLTLSRDDSAELAQLGGAEVTVRGVSKDGALDVHSFTVRAIDGAPVVDGVLGHKDGRLVLYTMRGPLALGNPPAAFDSLEHARVWVGGPLDTGPNVYGVIVRAYPSR